MWVVHHCLAWGSACRPQSWVDFLEMAAVVFLAILATAGLILGLNWLDDCLWG